MIASRRLAVFVANYPVFYPFIYYVKSAFSHRKGNNQKNKPSVVAFNYFINLWVHIVNKCV